MEGNKICKKCNKNLPLNSFRKLKGMKDGHLNYCNECEKENKLISFYNNKGLNIKSLSDYSIEQWWELYLNNTITCIPKKYFNQADMISIIKYVYYRKLDCKTKEDIINNFNQKTWKNFKIKSLIEKLKGKENALKLCFKDLNISISDFSIYSDIKLYKLLDTFIIDNDISIIDILDGKISIDKHIPKISAFLCCKEINYIDMWLNYFNHNNIRHPYTNKKILRYDFKIQSKNIYKNINTRTEKIKYYCEYICGDSILNYIGDNIKLRNWIKKYFNSECIKNNNLSGLEKYYKNHYDILASTYPSIIENKVLFQWEWNTCVNRNKDFWVNAIREFFLFRMNYSLSECKDALPNIVNFQYFKEREGKFNDCILRKKLFKNYKEWLILSFSELEWKDSDFNTITSIDGFIMDSIEEKNVYEFIQRNNIFKDIFPNSKNRKYVYQVNSELYNYFIPDFVIENVFVNNKKIKLKKPLIFEYYGMWNNGWHTNKIFLDYIEKTKFKEEFYKSNNDIYYIGIFPNDIKNNFQGLAEKLSLFCMENLKQIA